MKPRVPQMTLRLGSHAAPVTPWGEGTALPYLGSALTLHLSTDRHAAVRDGQTLHLPLPPEAGERQIRDAAEAWLRREAEHYLAASLQRLATAQGRQPPRLALSFAAKGDWISPEPDCLRCNWRLIEQPAAVIEQLLQRALGRLSAPAATADLFGLG